VRGFYIRVYDKPTGKMQTELRSSTRIKAQCMDEKGMPRLERPTLGVLTD